MPRLATPFMYEPALEELNAIRPLELSDEVKRLVSLPVLCVNPVSTNRPAVGKLARCDKQGSLLKSDSVGFNNVETFDLIWLRATPRKNISFSQPVKGVLFYWTSTITGFSVYWIASDPVYPCLEIIKEVYTYLSFVGKDISFGSYGDPNWDIYYSIRGFY